MHQGEGTSGSARPFAWNPEEPIMTRKLIAALWTLALVMPALGQETQEQYPDEQGGAWNEPPPPQQGSYPEEGRANVDVSVDLATPGAAVTFDTFQEGLAPYGQWTTVPNYGRVWRPAHVAAGWRPYYYGRWEWTDEGWLWVSDEPWGWAAYHYGRWAYDSSYGWVWIPGYQWAPAWVTWRYSPEYIGWAPLGPGFSVYVTSYPAVYGWWTFVPCRRFAGFPVYASAFTGGHVRNIFHATQPAPPRAAVFGVRAPAWGGPARPFVEQRVGHAIRPVRVQPVSSPSAAVAAPVRAGVVQIYRPEARLPGARAAAPAPARAFTQGKAAPAQGGSRGPVTAAPARPGTARSGQPGSPPAAAVGPSRARGGMAPAPARPPASSAPPRPQGYDVGRSGGYAPRPQGNAPPGAGLAGRPQASPAQRGGGFVARPQAPAPRAGGLAPRPQANPVPHGGGFIQRPQGGGQGHQGGGPARQGGNHGAVPAPAQHHR
jgi:hypothetical protein